jgi:hypothetical protein
VTPITKSLPGCDGDHKTVESDTAAVRKTLNRGELPFKEVLLGQGKAAFCDRDHRCSPVRAP